MKLLITATAMYLAMGWGRTAGATSSQPLINSISMRSFTDPNPAAAQLAERVAQFRQTSPEGTDAEFLNSILNAATNNPNVDPNLIKSIQDVWTQLIDTTGDSIAQQTPPRPITDTDGYVSYSGGDTKSGSHTWHDHYSSFQYYKTYGFTDEKSPASDLEDFITMSCGSNPVDRSRTKFELISVYVASYEISREEQYYFEISCRRQTWTCADGSFHPLEGDDFEQSSEELDKKFCLEKFEFSMHAFLCPQPHESKWQSYSVHNETMSFEAKLKSCNVEHELYVDPTKERNARLSIFHDFEYDFKFEMTNQNTKNDFCKEDDMPVSRLVLKVGNSANQLSFASELIFECIRAGDSPSKEPTSTIPMGTEVRKLGISSVSVGSNVPGLPGLIYPGPDVAEGVVFETTIPQEFEEFRSTFEGALTTMTQDWFNLKCPEPKHVKEVFNAGGERSLEYWCPRKPQ